MRAKPGHEHAGSGVRRDGQPLPQRTDLGTRMRWADNRCLVAMGNFTRPG
jgi:hypothetical protein